MYAHLLNPSHKLAVAVINKGCILLVPMSKSKIIFLIFLLKFSVVEIGKDIRLKQNRFTKKHDFLMCID